MGDEIVIRRAESIDDYRACQAAQRRAWGIADDSYVVPVATMVGAQLHGGLVLGAFRPDGEAVGMSFAFLGRVKGRLCLYSQLTGVVPGQQAQGLGARLKYAQRDIARAEGIDVIAWAFDPLQAGNARFNIDKLGASAGRYVENMYGLRTDDLNAGVPTDRLIVEWPTTPGPRIAISPGESRLLPRLVQAAYLPDGTPEVGSVDLTLDGPPVLLEIPDDINGVRKCHPALAERWRQAVNRGFRAAFVAGYRAVGFLREESPRRGFYLLRQTQ
jgi:predicted GNAT superfamily acetyltransferase